MTQNDLYELVADFGEFICTGLKRDHYLARMIEGPEAWLMLADIVGDERAACLKNDPDQATAFEINTLIQRQIHEALDEQDPDITPALWMCESDNGQITLIEGWGEELTIELRFCVIGQYPSREDALDDLHRHYFTKLDPQEPIRRASA